MKVFLTLLVALVLPSASLAEGLFVKKKTETAPAEETAPETGPENSEAAAPPETPSKKGNAAPLAGNPKILANRYYANCLKQQGGVMSAESQKTFCACTAAQIGKSMTAEQMRAVSKETDEGKRQRTRLTTLVYVPCMEYPAYDLIRANCETDPAIKDNFKQYKKVCACLATGMSKYAAEESRRVVAAEVRKTGAASPDVAQLLNGLLSSEAFQLKSEYYAATCTQKHELGW